MTESQTPEESDDSEDSKTESGQAAKPARSDKSWPPSSLETKVPRPDGAK